MLFHVSTKNERDIREFGQSIARGWTRWPSISACIAAPWATLNPRPSAVVKTCVSFKLHFNQFIRSIDVCRWPLQFILCFCSLFCVCCDWKCRWHWNSEKSKLDSRWRCLCSHSSLLPTEAPIATLGKASNYRREKNQNKIIALLWRGEEWRMMKKMFNFRFDVFIIVKPSEKKFSFSCGT